MRSLDNYDVNKVVKRIPYDLIKVMQKDEWQGKIFLAGGFIRAVIANEKINDIDLFTQDANLLVSEFLATEAYETINAYTIRTLRYPIQIVKRWKYDTAEKVINDFDFSLCQAVIYYQDNHWQSLCSERFYIDLSAKRLIYTRPIREEEPAGSLIRVGKYLKKGYSIPLDSLAQVLARLIDKGQLIGDEIENSRTLEKLLGGI